MAGGSTPATHTPDASHALASVATDMVLLGTIWFGISGCLLVGVAIGYVVWWIASALASDELEQGDEWRFDISRINSLRKQDALFRLFQVVIQFFAKLNRKAFEEQLPEVNRQIQAAGLSRFWLAEEYIGRMQVISLLIYHGKSRLEVKK